MFGVSNYTVKEYGTAGRTVTRQNMLLVHTTAIVLAQLATHKTVINSR